MGPEHRGEAPEAGRKEAAGSGQHAVRGPPAADAKRESAANLGRAQAEKFGREAANNPDPLERLKQARGGAGRMRARAAEGSQPEAAPDDSHGYRPEVLLSLPGGVRGRPRVFVKRLDGSLE